MKSPGAPTHRREVERELCKLIRDGDHELVGLLAVTGVACSDDDDGGGANVGFVVDIPSAVDAVEAEMGANQDYFEVTATPQLTNVFVAIDDATAAVSYLFVDGELQPLAPTLTGASGFTFTAEAIDFDEDSILGAVCP